MRSYRKERAEVKKYVDSVIAKDYNTPNKKIWEMAHDLGFHMPFGFDYFRRIVLQSRKEHMPEMKSGPSADFDPGFDPHSIQGSENTKARAFLRNEIRREKYQASSVLLKKIYEAGIQPTAIKTSIIGWISTIRRELGRELSIAEAKALSESETDHGFARGQRGQPKVNLFAPPPNPGKIDLYAAKRLAADILRDAWDTANQRPSSAHKSTRYGARATDFQIRYSQAWLQTPGATAVWCDLLGVDADEVASISRQRHGKPSFSRSEINSFRHEQANRAAYIDVERQESTDA